jgi:hypothetical protein
LRMLVTVIALVGAVGTGPKAGAVVSVDGAGASFPATLYKDALFAYKVLRLLGSCPSPGSAR